MLQIIKREVTYCKNERIVKNLMIIDHRIFGNTQKENINSIGKLTTKLKKTKQEMFSKLYKVKPQTEDDPEDDTSDKRGTLYEYIGAPISIAQVPWPFYLEAPWGARQFLQAKSYIVFNPNTGEWYGTAGARDRKPGQLENTYTLADDDPRTISKSFRMVIASDRSPLPGLQFNLKDVAKAYAEAGKDLGKFERYL